MTSDKKANRLISESSPYLLQHAYNPVDWYPWSDEALDKAVKEDKPVLVSIGYSACHWCHVMERESFENIRIANYLNKYFISIKVDREERPDIDHVYMDAVHAMGVQGGWPLNVFLTPEQKPFFGGTYFPPQTFYEILENVITAYNTRREKLDLSATELANHLSKSEVVKYGLSGHHFETDENDLLDGMGRMRKKFDLDSGGFDKAPKFPMPSLWEFILRCGYFLKESQYIKHAIFTLQKMARGGIYDQLGGGFARYSVDDKWFAPHFEKMLYDNGQLLSLYSEAFILSGEEEFAEVIRGIANFLNRELRHPDGGYFAALDADSEGVEGKFYTWQEDDFKRTVGKEAEFWSDYFGISRDGNWENQENIITRHKSIAVISDKFNCSLEEAKNILSGIKERLLEKREERVRPGLDDKILAGWNGIVLIGLTEAYNALNDEGFLQQALDNANYLMKNHIREQQLFRTPVGKGRLVPGYLEDYAFVIQGFVKLYQATFDELWLWKAKEMAVYTLENFFDEKEGFFYYSDKNIRQLIATKKEVFDNVIPSSNSVMAENLYLLGFFFDEEAFRTKAEGMMDRMKKLLMTEPEYSANWGRVYLMMTHPIAEIAIIGKDPMTIRDQINKHYHPNKIFCGTNLSSELPLLKGRKNFNHNTIYVCYNKSCNFPVHTAEEAIKLLV